METLRLKTGSSEQRLRNWERVGSELRETERLPETEGLGAGLGRAFCVAFIHGLGFPC